MFNNKQHPKELNNPEIEYFLNHLAVSRGVSAATQNQALCALIFMYRHVIRREIENLNYKFSKRPKSLPTVLTPNEVIKILGHLHGKYWLIASLLYGTGLRIKEALTLRIKDIDFERNTVFVYRGKGGKDRYTLLPTNLTTQLKSQIKFVEEIHKQDVNEGFGHTSIASGLSRKYQHTLKELS